jgi:hypothetical protein
VLVGVVGVGGKEAACEKEREEGELVEALARADEELEVGREEESAGEEEVEEEVLEEEVEEEVLEGRQAGGGRGGGGPTAGRQVVARQHGRPGGDGGGDTRVFFVLSFVAEIK